MIEYNCDLFLAPSTIANGGLGIFTGKELHRGDYIGTTGDVAIPIIDLEWNNAKIEGESFPNPFDDYVWNGRSMGMGPEVGDLEWITTYWPGLDAMVNSFSPLINLERSLPDYDPDINATMHRSKDPGMGSFSPYVGGRSFVHHHVPVGGELFKDYGNNWFFQRNMTSPVITDIIQAQQLLQLFSWRVHPNVKPDAYQLLLDLKEIWDSPRLFQAIPDNWNKAEEIVHHHNLPAIQHSLRQWYQPNATRSLEWLKEHGTCLDVMETAPSTISGAGRGAFAKKSFEAGEVVTTSPLIHILDKSILELWEIGSDPTDPQRLIRRKRIGTQLVINYCFSHPETTLALCPYGKGINSINHSSEKVNLRVEWPADQFLNHNASYITMPPNQWNTLKPQLAIHYVATKPIAPGEELFLDYGPTWQEAWEKHVLEWRLSDIMHPLPHGQDYVNSVEWNRQHNSTDILWTAEEIEENYTRENPPYLQLRCHSDLLSLHHSRYYKLKWEGDFIDGAENPEYGLPCRVTGRIRRGDTYDYDVIIDTIANHGAREIQEVQRSNVPRRLLKWFDKPHTTDIHLHLSFRQPLGLPDSMVSKEWKFVAQQSQHSKFLQENIALEPIRSPGIRPQQGNETLEDNTTCSAAIPQMECDLYLAASSIPGAGLGIFAGKEYHVGDSVGSGDIAIVVNSVSGYSNETLGNFFENPFQDYVWNASNMGICLDEDLESVGLFWPGINAAVNCYPALINVETSYPEFDTANVHRFRHPSAGSFSPYHKGISHAIRDIPVGGELFKEYGEAYFLTRDNFEGVPVGRDFDAARAFLETFLDFTKAHLPLRKTLFDSSASIASIWNRRLFNALPPSLESSIDLMETFSGDFGKFLQPNRTRDLSWLNEHGRCIDHIIPKQSTLEGAGRGAFAKRFLPKGTILTASPLLPVRKHMLIPSSSGDRSNRVTTPQQDLVLNYCFGAPASSLYLCPYSAGINYINHNQTLANVRVQWASHSSMGHDDRNFDISPSRLDSIHGKSSLVFDYIVTKDIAKDEEIFLDYGDEFEQAWNRHVAAWQPDDQWESYISAGELNQVVRNNNIFFRTEEEQVTDPYPANIVVRCHPSLGQKTMKDLLRFGLRYNNQKHMDSLFPWCEEENHTLNCGYPCTIKNRVPTKHGFTYDVTITVEDSSGNVAHVERTNLPKEAIRFFDRPHTSDIYLKSTFRHAIGIPNEMVPPVWRDLSQ